MSRLSIFLARYMGLFILIVVIALLVRGTAIVNDAAADRQVIFIWALVSLATGLALVLGHNRWSQSALTVVVSLVGWLVLVKGLVLLFVPAESLLNALHYREHDYLYLVPATIIGLYLTWAGFTSRMSPGT